MENFLRWFKPGAKIKRWLMVMLLGIVMVCYSISKILFTQDQLSFWDLAKIVVTFILGCTTAIIGIIFIQKRTLELLVEESDTRGLGKKNSVNSLIFNKKVYDQGPNVVAIGGGSGLNTVLKGLKNYTDNITAIVTLSDYGTTNKNSKFAAMDDIKDSLIALSNNEEKMSQLLNTKMGNDGTREIKFSDLYFQAMETMSENFTKSIEESKNILKMTGRVLPATLDKVTICAELEDGTVVESKEKIPQVVNEKVSKINRIYLSPTNCTAAPGVIDAIKNADAIIIGPGSLYTNIIPNLLIPGISKAIKEAKGFKIYVSNIMTEFGQTDNYSLSEHVKAIIDHAGKGIIDYCIYDTGEIVPEYIKKYNREGSELVEQDTSNVKGLGIKLIQRNLSTIENDTIRHNPDAIATTIIQLICEDLKFNDMQNDAQFIRLDAKVKQTKKRLKEEEKNKDLFTKNRKRKGNKKTRTSKFYNKYNERIESIKESSKKTATEKELEIKETNQALKDKPTEEIKINLNTMEEPVMKAKNKEEKKLVKENKTIDEKKNKENTNNLYGIKHRSLSKHLRKGNHAKGELPNINDNEELLSIINKMRKE